MKLILNVVLLYILYISGIYSKVLQINDKKQAPSDVSFENQYGIDIYTPKQQNYNAVAIFGKKLTTKSDWFITQFLLLKINSTTYLKIVTMDSKNNPVTNYYLNENSKLSLAKLDDIYPKLLENEKNNTISTETLNLFIPIPSHPICDNSKNDDEDEDDVKSVSSEASQASESSEASKGDLRGTHHLDNPEQLQALPEPDNVQSALLTNSVHEFTAEFCQHDSDEVSDIIEKVTLDSTVGITGVTKDDTSEQYTLYTIDGGFKPEHHINNVLFGPLLLEYDDDHFINLIALKSGVRHVEVLSKHEQGFYTMIYDGDKYQLDHTISRIRKLPMPIEGRHVILDLINPNMNEIQKIAEIKLFPNYSSYHLNDNDLTIDLRCMNVDVYLSSEEKNRQIHVEIKDKDITGVTTTSEIDGNLLVRSFNKEGQKYVFINI